jgi:hypothetical protein
MLKELEKEEEDVVLKIVDIAEYNVNAVKGRLSVGFFLSNFLSHSGFIDTCDYLLITRLGFDKGDILRFRRATSYWKPEIDGCYEGYGVYFSLETNYYYFFYGRYYDKTGKYEVHIKKLTDDDIKKWKETGIFEGKQLK